MPLTFYQSDVVLRHCYHIWRRGGKDLETAIHGRDHTLVHGWPHYQFHSVLLYLTDFL